MKVAIYSAEWVMPISSPPIRDGAVAVRGEQIVFVGAKAEADLRPEFHAAEKFDFGRAAILPGLVNAHSHLELALMRGFLEDLDFRSWIVKLTRAKYDRLTNDDLAASARLGAAEAIRSGITTLADTGDTGSAFDALIESGLRGIAYREVFGPNPGDMQVNLDGLKQKVIEMRERQSNLVKVGVSPHAPYTVSAELFQKTIEYARHESLDVCIHTAESIIEQQMMLAGGDAFSLALRERGINWQAPGVSTIEYFNRLGVLEAAPLLVHCVQADEQDISLIAGHNARVAHCPKSNSKLGHGIAPLKAMLDAGVVVGLGTDSVASNNRCDILSEARFCGLIHRAHGRDYLWPDAAGLLKFSTLDGARALGLDDRIGSLEINKQADLIAIDLSRTHNSPLHDPATAIIFSAIATDVIQTVVAGRVLYDGREVKTLDEPALRDRVNATLKRLH